MLTDEKIAEIRDSVDLVALISEYVPLRRQGARFVGLCPFHQEKSPSFGVSRGKNFYYCFGCQASGDAISFLRHVEGLGFGDAIAKLAERAGIELPRTDDKSQAQIDRARSQRERLSEVMEHARAFFEASLSSAEHAEIARAEIEARGVQPELAQRFRLGYAPMSWDGLARYLTQKRVDPRDAVDVGLIAPRRQGPGHYDRFRHRLMFPVSDQHGRLLAFSGRALNLPEGTPAEAAPPAKYINSPEGPLYKKGHVLYGLEQARIAMRKKNQVVLCEGNFDLIALHQAGFDNALAPLGTAFTLDQAKLIRRFVEDVVVVFDGDGAGRKATRAAFELLESANLQSRAVRLPDGFDPDTFLREHGA
ncbi:MAG TPA: DNA primase, partial [Polyangiales bacterium]